jgi:hypothetical protein
MTKGANHKHRHSEPNHGLEMPISFRPSQAAENADSAFQSIKSPICCQEHVEGISEEARLKVLEERDNLGWGENQHTPPLQQCARCRCAIGLRRSSIQLGRGD